MNTGISVIVTVNQYCPELDKLLDSFFATNTFSPVELIIVDQSGIQEISDIIARHSTKGCLRQLIRVKHHNNAVSANHAAQKSRYPYLLFIENNILFSVDLLPLALGRLDQDGDAGAIEADLKGLYQLPDAEDKAFSTGNVCKDEKKYDPGINLNSVLRTRNRDNFSTDFLLCRKTDFDHLSGFRPKADFFLRDFCLRLEQELGKDTLRIDEQGCIIKLDKGRLRLRYFPSYSNPYQRLLYQHFPEYFCIQPGSQESILDDMQKDNASLAFIFHLHWTNPVLEGAESQERALEQLQTFLQKLDTFLEQGGILVWTVHNILPHETQYPELEQELCQAVVSRAQIIHVHSPLVPGLAKSVYEIPLSKLTVAPHGNYLQVYPNTRNKDQARQELDLPRQAPVFLFLGQIRPYKGLARLQEAFAACLDKYPEAILLLAGKLKEIGKDELARLFAETPGVRLYPGYVPDEEVGLYLQAADYMVLPYERVLTSGSVILAQSYALPPIVPDLGILKEHVKDGESGFLYDPDDPVGLTRAMLKALENHGQHAKLSAGALQAARSLPWRHSAAVLAARILSEVY